MVEIIPAILTNDIKEIEEKLRLVERASLAEDSPRGEAGVKSRRVQIDIIDGQFAANRTVDPSALEGIETDLELDFHLMTKEPTDWVERAGRGGADRIIGQIEKMSDQLAFLGKVQEIGAKVGLAIDIETPVSSLDSVVLTNLDVVLVMATPAGFGGQKFDPKALSKVKQLDEARKSENSRFRICVDGGETTEVIEDSRLAGADEIVVGRRIFEGDLAENIDKFVKAAYGK